MMKRLLRVFLAAALTFLVAGCTAERPEQNAGRPADNEQEEGKQEEGEQEGDKQEDDDMRKIIIKAGGREFRAKLCDNEAARAFAERLPVTLDMNELNGNEKYSYLSESLPSEAERPGQIQEGDLMLFGTDCVVLFYESFSTSYSYTPLGYVEDASGLAQALGAGSIQVSFS